MQQTTAQTQTEPKPSLPVANAETAAIAPRPFPTRATFGDHSASID